MHFYTLLLPLLAVACAQLGLAQSQSSIPNTFPHAWPGQPNGTFSPAWQQCASSYPIPAPSPSFRSSDDTHAHAIADFEVTEKLPSIPSGLPRMFAGNIPVNRAGHPNDTLFFWAFEKAGANGTLTAPADVNNTDPWIIWLQGG